MGKVSVAQNTCKVGQEYRVKFSSDCPSTAHKCHTDAVKVAEQAAQSCAKSLEQRTGLPHFAQKTFDPSYIGPDSFTPYYCIEGCFERGHITGENDARVCAQALSRVTGKSYEAKLAHQRLFSDNIYIILKK